MFIPRGENSAFQRLTSLVWNPYLAAVREGFTLTLPVILAGTLAILINSFPWDAYQDAMVSVFGGQWKVFGSYVYTGTFGVLAVIMTLSIGLSLAEDHNAHHPVGRVPPAIFAFVTCSCLLATTEPVHYAATPGGTGELAFLLRWLGVHGLLSAIATALLSCSVLRLLLGVSCLRMTLYSGSTGSSMAQTMSSLVPAMLTILLFAGIKGLLFIYGVENIDEEIYRQVSLPFRTMGEGSLFTALVYGLIRHLLWFVGIHGSNVLEPIMQEVYVPALHANMANFNAQLPVTAIFTKPFFDCYTSMGGSGSTLGLLIACFLRHKDSGTRKIATLSLIPSIFNINEMLLFGLPVVLNPVFLIPFILVPFIATVISYWACAWGLVPLTVSEVAWNIPVFINGYLAAESIRGLVLQVINLAMAVVVYLPFVVLDNRIKADQFNHNFKKLVTIAVEGDEIQSGPRLLNRPDPIGSLAGNLAGDMGGALRRGEFYLEYQPQVNSDTGRVYGVESLMRWRHPHLGMIPPPVFIGLAEDSGYILQLGLWGMEQSVRQRSLWRQAGVKDVVMSVNVSAKQLEDPTLPDKIMDILGRYRVPVEDMKLEVTESIALTSQMAKNEVLARLHALHFTLAIDDFGMGHSSLTYLKKFPVGSLKLDAILSRDVLASRSSCEIIASIAELCRTLNINLVAEYVEDEAHLLKLRSLGCSNIQGYFYSPPLGAEDAFNFITKTHTAYGENLYVSDIFSGISGKSAAE